MRGNPLFAVVIPANNHDHLVTTEHESPGATFQYPSPRRRPGSIPRLAGLDSGFRRNDESANPEAGTFR